MVSAPEPGRSTTTFARSPYSFATRRTARSSAGSTDAPKSGSSTSPVFRTRGLAPRWIGSRVLAMAEEEGRRRGCTRIALMTLTIEAPGFYPKQGYDVAATIDCEPPGLTRY